MLKTGLCDILFAMLKGGMKIKSLLTMLTLVVFNLSAITFFFPCESSRHSDSSNHTDIHLGDLDEKFHLKAHTDLDAPASEGDCFSCLSLQKYAPVSVTLVSSVSTSLAEQLAGFMAFPLAYLDSPIPLEQPSSIVQKQFASGHKSSFVLSCRKSLVIQV